MSVINSVCHLYHYITIDAIYSLFYLSMHYKTSFLFGINIKYFQIYMYNTQKKRKYLCRLWHKYYWLNFRKMWKFYVLNIMLSIYDRYPQGWMCASLCACLCVHVCVCMCLWRTMGDKASKHSEGGDSTSICAIIIIS